MFAKIALVLSVIVLFGFENAGKPLHPIHLSVTEVAINSETQSLEITHKIFLEDMEDALEEMFDEKIRFAKSLKPNKNNLEYLKKYFAKTTEFKVNEKQELSPKLLGTEVEEENIYVFREASLDLKTVKSITFVNEILLELFEDQKNILNIKHKSEEFNFILDNQNTKKTIKLND